MSQKRSYPVIENPFTSCKTTEVHISSEPAKVSRSDSQASLCDDHGNRAQGYNPYTVSVGIGSAASEAIHTRHASSGRASHRTPANEVNSAAWGYTKCAMLFFISLIITWVSRTMSNSRSISNQTLSRRRFPQRSTVSTVSCTPKWSASPSTTHLASSCPCKGSGMRSSTPSHRYPRVEPFTDHCAIANGRNSARALRRRVPPKASCRAVAPTRFLMFYAVCPSVDGLSYVSLHIRWGGLVRSRLRTRDKRAVGCFCACTGVAEEKSGLDMI